MNLTELINDLLSEQKQEPRAYVGASSIGNPCERAIWYGLNHPEYKVVTPKQLITFEIGKRLEAMILDYLAKKLLIMSPYTMVHKSYPKFQGNADAVLLDSNMQKIALIEIKTAKESSFNLFKKKGLRLWNPEYYDQVQSYMGLSDIPVCFELVLNKNTSEFWDEQIEFDAYRYDYLVEKAKRIGEAVCIPPRISNSPSYHRCKMCFYQEACFG